MRPCFSLPARLLAASLAISSAYAVTPYAVYHLGESGSLGANNLPLDSSGNGRNFVSNISGSTTATDTTGVVAPGSTTYLSTAGVANEGWYSSNLFSSLPTDNFATGLYVRASANPNTSATIFALGGSNGSFSFSLDPGGWRASAFNVGYIGGTSPFTADQWVHLAIIRSGGISTFYADGVVIGATYSGAPVNNTAHLAVKPGGLVYFNGQMDEARTVTFTAGESTGDILDALRGVSGPYAAWAGTKGLTAGVNDAKGQDPDNDGWNNFAEFAFDGLPLSGASDGKIVSKVAIVSVDGQPQNVLTLTLPVRGTPLVPVFSGDTELASVASDGIVYRVQCSADLIIWNAFQVTELAPDDASSLQATLNLPSLSTGWTYRSFCMPGFDPVSTPRAFMRAVVQDGP